MEGRPQAAVREAERALEHDSGHLWKLAFLTEACARLGRDREARERMNSALGALRAMRKLHEEPLPGEITRVLASLAVPEADQELHDIARREKQSLLPAWQLVDAATAAHRLGDDPRALKWLAAAGRKEPEVTCSPT
jgi:hypothetical protein